MKVPPELFEPIADHLTETSDLLSLGLTCKYLATIILRYNLFYHTISANFGRNKLWIYLITYPQLARHVRRLQIHFDITPNPKMRLPFDTDIDVGVYHSYQGPQNTSSLLWSYELLGRALRQMVNLKAFEWLYPESLLFDVNSDAVQPFSNRHILEQGDGLDGRFVSLYDTRILCSNNLISLSLITATDTFDSGKSVISFLTTCHELKYLKLQTNDQAFVGDLMSLCRWPKLQVLDLNITDDPSEPPTEECIRDFIAYHSSIVSLTWYISLVSPNRLPLPILSFNSLPHLVAVEGSANDIWPVIFSPCTPPRPLKKIIHFPTAAEFWSQPERSFQSISKSSLRIVAIAAKQISQLTKLAALFPNIECIDLAGSEVYQRGVTWEDEAPMVNKVLTGLSVFTNLRVIFGFRFWNYSETEEMRETPRRREYFRSVHTLLPRLDFCVGYQDGIEFIREGNDVGWEWFGWPSSEEYVGFNRERDFTIREECDRFAS